MDQELGEVSGAVHLSVVHGIRVEDTARAVARGIGVTRLHNAAIIAEGIQKGIRENGEQTSLVIQISPESDVTPSEAWARLADAATTAAGMGLTAEEAIAMIEDQNGEPIEITAERAARMEGLIPRLSVGEGGDVDDDSLWSGVDREETDDDEPDLDGESGVSPMNLGQWATEIDPGDE